MYRSLLSLGLFFCQNLCSVFLQAQSNGIGPLFISFFTQSWIKVSEATVRSTNYLSQPLSVTRCLHKKSPILPLGSQNRDHRVTKSILHLALFSMWCGVVESHLAKIVEISILAFLKQRRNWWIRLETNLRGEKNLEGLKMKRKTNFLIDFCLIHSFFLTRLPLLLAFTFNFLVYSLIATSKSYEMQSYFTYLQ